MKPEATLDKLTGVLRGLSTLEWILLAGAVLVVIALGIAGVLWWRRRSAAARPAAVASPAVTPAVPLGKLLISDARAFWRGMPAPARRARDAFHPVVVLGTESSGKMALTERFSRVAQRRAELGPRVEHTDGELRSQLGSDAVVFDLSEAVTRVPREPLATGLARALAPMLRRRAPVVVVCLSPEALDKHSEQQLGELGEFGELGSALRAKLAVLAALRDEPCAVRVVISDVPGFARFDALFRLLQLPGEPAALSIEGHDDASLYTTLLGETDALAGALTELTPREALDLVALFKAIPPVEARNADGVEDRLARLLGLLAAGRVFAGVRSPMRELLEVAARDASLGLAGDKTGYSDALRAIEDRCGALAAVFVAGKHGDAFVAYQDVLRDLAARLAVPPPAGKPADPAAAITGRVSAAGSLTFALTGAAPAWPLADVQAWLAANALPAELAEAFRKPVRAVYGIGELDVEAGIAGWYRELEVSADAELFSRFPFDRRSSDDLDPQALITWLHPKHGRLASRSC